MIYEVQSNGVTVEWTRSLKEADDAYKEAGRFGTKMYAIRGTQKHEIRSK